MLKISLVALFVTIMGTLTLAASAMPVPPEVQSRPTIQVADAA